MNDAVTRYRAATEQFDIDAAVATLADDAELVSPISGRMVFRGQIDLRTLLAAIYASMTELQWTHEVGDDSMRMVMGEALVGPLRITDVMVLEMAGDGRIRRIRPHVRPWLALTTLAVVFGAKLGRHPAVIWRALHNGGASAGS